MQAPHLPHNDTAHIAKASKAQTRSRTSGIYVLLGAILGLLRTL